MSLKFTFKDLEIGVGDKVRVYQKIKEGDKERTQQFEGILIGIRGREENKSFTVRKIGAQQIGIERVFPVFSPTIEKIAVVRKGTEGVKRSKLYYIREKSRREIEEIYFRGFRKGKIPQSKKTSKKKTKK